MEYCSRVPPPQQAAAAPPVPPPTVMVPVGVLKREGEYCKPSFFSLPLLSPFLFPAIPFSHHRLTFSSYIVFYNASIFFFVFLFFYLTCALSLPLFSTITVLFVSSPFSISQLLFSSIFFLFSLSSLSFSFLLSTSFSLSLVPFSYFSNPLPFFFLPLSFTDITLFSISLYIVLSVCLFACLVLNTTMMDVFFS